MPKQLYRRIDDPKRTKMLACDVKFARENGWIPASDFPKDEIKPEIKPSKAPKVEKELKPEITGEKSDAQGEIELPEIKAKPKPQAPVLPKKQVSKRGPKPQQ